MRDPMRVRAFVALTVGAALLLAPAATMAAGRPVKPPKGPVCSLSQGVSMTSIKSKGNTSWIITGTAGADLIDCRASTATVGVTVYTVDGDDWVWGTPMADAIFVQGTTDGAFTYVSAEGGNDYIEGGWGDANAYSRQTIEGGAGDDLIIATGGVTQAWGNDGNDTIDIRRSWNGNVRGGAGNDLIRGPQEAGCGAGCSNPLFGDGGDDIIFGGPARDDIDGGAGTDEMHGADGDDLLMDSGSGAETFDCGNGWDIIHDLDGNGVGGNGTGYLGTAEDDDHVDCETVLVAAASCSYTPGSTGCIVLSDVAITDDPSTATYLVSGTVTFSPSCNPLVPPCDHTYPNSLVTGSGTFSVSGSQTASGTWTVPASPNDRPNTSAPFQFLDASSSFTTCNAAVIRSITFNLPLVASNGDTGGGFLTVRTDDVGTSDVVGGSFFIGPLPAGSFRNPADSQAGVDYNC